MTDAIGTLPVVTRDTDGKLSTIPFGELCCVCVERAAVGGDQVCEQCRRDWEENAREANSAHIPIGE
jgi:hypothetical protein